MKCARCHHDSTYPQRTGGKCPGCGGKFAFEPRSGDPINDMAFKAAIDWVSSTGTVRFTLPHLHHAVARRIKKPQSGGSFVFFGLAVALFIGAGLTGSGVAAVIAVVLMLIGIVFAVARRMAPSRLQLLYGAFTTLYERWVAAHGAPKALIVPRAIGRAPSQLAEELESYSFDRAVICDRSETVDLLLGNNFHFENNCAVLTAGGYPEHAAPTVRKMLRKNPRLEVFVLHDATVEGCVLAHLLKSDHEWFGGSDVRVFDVALRPAQAQKMPTLTWETVREVPEHPALTRDERTWLASHWMSLAAISPEQTIKRLYRAMQTMPTDAKSTAVDGGSSSSDVIIWTTDAHASDGGGDSFG